MNTLVLKPTPHSLAFATFQNAADEASLESALALHVFDRSVHPYPAEVFHRLRHAIGGTIPADGPDVIGVRGVYGGPDFPHPVRVSDTVLAHLKALAPHAPLHLPNLVEFLHGIRSAFPGVPVILTFETSFFASLPVRERLYGLDPATMKAQAIRRFGFNGLYHEAASQDAARRLRLRVPRVLSFCLEPRPELAAVAGRRPVMVTGGATPIEGLPGEQSCGDLDPSVVLKLAHDTQWGPEGASRILSRESGLRALAGRPVTLPEVLDSDTDELRLAREVFLHHALRACGAGIAAMGGIDAIVYSGRYAASGNALDAWLRPRLVEATQTEYRQFICFRRLLQIVNRQTRVAAREIVPR